jgi:hypothetical protein
MYFRFRGTFSLFSDRCSRCSGCAMNRDTCFELAATGFTGYNASPSTGLFCDWTPSKREKYAFFSNPVYEAWNNKHYNACIFCDIATALNSASHEVPLSKLEHYSVMGIVLNWFRSYLHDRRQSVSLKCTATHCFQSGCESIKRGVPRGSDLDPILFNTYV